MPSSRVSCLFYFKCLPCTPSRQSRSRSRSTQYYYRQSTSVELPSLTLQRPCCIAVVAEHGHCNERPGRKETSHCFSVVVEMQMADRDGTKHCHVFNASINSFRCCRSVIHYTSPQCPRTAHASAMAIRPDVAQHRQAVRVPRRQDIQQRGAASWYIRNNAVQRRSGQNTSPTVRLYSV